MMRFWMLIADWPRKLGGLVTGMEFLAAYKSYEDAKHAAKAQWPSMTQRQLEASPGVFEKRKALSAARNKTSGFYAIVIGLIYLLQPILSS